MAIAVTALHGDRLRDQLWRNLVSLHSDMYRNAATHKAMAVAQSPSLATLQGFWTSAAASYANRLSWVTALQANAPQLAIAVAALQRVGLSTADVTALLTPLQTVVTGMQAANIMSYADISIGCDQITAFLGPPISLWPE